MNSFGVVSKEDESLKFVRYSFTGEENIINVELLIFENLYKLNEFCCKNNIYIIKKYKDLELLPTPILEYLNSKLVSVEIDLIVLPFVKIYKKDITFCAYKKIIELPTFSLLINPKTPNLLYYILSVKDLFIPQFPKNLKLNIYFHNIYSLIFRQNENKDEDEDEDESRSLVTPPYNHPYINSSEADVLCHAFLDVNNRLVGLGDFYNLGSDYKVFISAQKLLIWELIQANKGYFINKYK